MKEKLHIIPHQHKVDKRMRNKQNQHKSLLVWFTGLSGSGKSTIAGRVEHLLLEQGIHTYLLDGDNVRTGLNKGLSFTAEDRHENLRRIAEVSKLFLDAGIVVLGAFVSPLAKDRRMIAEIVENYNFVEIHVATSYEECERRDVKGLYKKARQGEITNFTGLDAPYEEPVNPDIVLHTTSKSVDDCAREVLNYLLNNKKLKQL